MRLDRRFLSLFLVLPLTLAGCGKDDGGADGPTLGSGSATLAAEKTPQGIGRLVPQDTIAMLYVPSIEALETKLRTVVTSVDEGAGTQIDASKALAGLGPVGELVDRKRPLVLALVPQGEEAAPVAILPVTDVEEAKQRTAPPEGAPAGMRGPEPIFEGDYMLMPMMPDTAIKRGDGVPAIAARMPRGDLAVRIDMAAIVERFGDDFEQMTSQQMRGMSGMPGPGGAQLAGMAETMTANMQELMRAAEHLDLALRIDGTRVSLEGLFAVKEGSALAGASAPEGLDDLAGLVQQEAPIYALFQLDMAAMMDVFEPIWEASFSAFPPEQREAFEQQMEASRRLSEHMGDRHAMSIMVGEGGMSGVLVSAGGDPEAYWTEVEALLGSELYTNMGMEFEVEGVKVAEHDARRIRLRFDMAKMMAMSGQEAGEVPPEAREQMDQMMATMFGPEGPTVWSASVGDKMISVMGSRDLLATTIEAAEEGRDARGAVAKALDATGGRPSFLLRVELRQLIGGFLELAEHVAGEAGAGIPMPELGEGASAEIVVHTRASGRHYAGGITLDVEAVAKVVKELMGAAGGGADDEGDWVDIEEPVEEEEPAGR